MLFSLAKPVSVAVLCWQCPPHSLPPPLQGCCVCSCSNDTEPGMCEKQWVVGQWARSNPTWVSHNPAMSQSGSWARGSPYLQTFRAISFMWESLLLWPRPEISLFPSFPLLLLCLLGNDEDSSVGALFSRPLPAGQRWTIVIDRRREKSCPLAWSPSDSRTDLIYTALLVA